MLQVTITASYKTIQGILLENAYYFPYYGHRLRDMLKELTPYLSAWFSEDDTVLTDMLAWIDQGFEISDWVAGLFANQGMN